MNFNYAIANIFLAATLIATPPEDPRGTAPTALSGDSSAAISMSYEPVNTGDLLYIYVADYADITRSYRVSQNGTISIPVFKEPLPVTGLMPTEVEKAVAQGLLDAKLLVKPVVSVGVPEYRSRPVQISGAVKHPVTVQALGEMRLLDALAKADGLDSDAGAEILVLRPGAITSETSKLHIPVPALLAGLDPALNVTLHGGEQILVPRAGKLYIVGNVRNPGVFPFTEADGLSVLKALGLCQGALPFSHADAILYRLIPGSSLRTEITVHLNDILNHRAADVPLQPNDVFYVAEYSGKRLAAKTLDRITGIGASAATIGLWHSIP
jgi:polysaccharide biosynthesis/export protein